MVGNIPVVRWDLVSPVMRESSSCRKGVWIPSFVVPRHRCLRRRGGGRVGMKGNRKSRVGGGRGGVERSASPSLPSGTLRGRRARRGIQIAMLSFVDTWMALPVMASHVVSSLALLVLRMRGGTCLMTSRIMHGMMRMRMVRVTLCFLAIRRRYPIVYLVLFHLVFLPLAFFLFFLCVRSSIITST